MNWWAAVVYDGCDARVSVGGKSAPTSWPVYSCTALQPLVSSRGSSPANRGHTPNTGSGSGALMQTCWRCLMRPPHINTWKSLPQSFRGDCFHPLKSVPPGLFRCKKVSHQVSSHLNLIIIYPLIVPLVTCPSVVSTDSKHSLFSRKLCCNCEYHLCLKWNLRTIKVNNLCTRMYSCNLIPHFRWIIQSSIGATDWKVSMNIFQKKIPLYNLEEKSWLFMMC